MLGTLWSSYTYLSVHYPCTTERGTVDPGPPETVLVVGVLSGLGPSSITFVTPLCSKSYARAGQEARLNIRRRQYDAPAS